MEMSEDVYQNIQMESRPPNKKNDWKGNKDSRMTSLTKTQNQQSSPVSSRVMTGLVTLCAGLLLVLVAMCALVTYQQVQQSNPSLEYTFSNLSAHMNAQVEHLTQEVTGALGKLNAMQEMMTRLNQDYSTVTGALGKLNAMQEMMTRLNQDYSTVTGALGKLNAMQEMMTRLNQDYSTVSRELAKLQQIQETVNGIRQDHQADALQKDMKKSLSALERLSECARKQPNNTLGPLCDASWSQFQLNCYKRYDEKKTWTDAKKHCESQYSHLVVINDKAEQEHMKELSANTYSWIGLTDADGTWKWIDGTRYVYVKEFWFDEQPDNWLDPNYDEREDCAHIRPINKWNDAHCSIQMSFICEKEI